MRRLLRARMSCTLTRSSEELAKQQEKRGSSKTPASRSRCCCSSTRRRRKPRRTTLSTTPLKREWLGNKERPLDEVPVEEEEAWEVTFPMERMPPAKQAKEPPRSSNALGQTPPASANASPLFIAMPTTSSKKNERECKSLSEARLQQVLFSASRATFRTP